VGKEKATIWGRKTGGKLRFEEGGRLESDLGREGEVGVALFR